ncbi:MULTISPECIES: hypothetical protein [Bradyrhizobium]|uniref:hypothetical protein n=1 Tax=Bradyrhizobium TaxID=374 RepID=UPI00155E9775|nr:MULTISPECIES: hypothetical protein [Bradyrhizobium]UUO32344.1 hypothetical protein DCG74_36955 [Bradyrhizobium sp. WBAH42]
MRLTTAHHDHVVDPNASMHPGSVTKMLDENLACIRLHRNNIRRYRSLLETHLSELERQFIDLDGGPDVQHVGGCCLGGIH